MVIEILAFKNLTPYSKNLIAATPVKLFRF